MKKRAREVRKKGNRCRGWKIKKGRSDKSNQNGKKMGDEGGKN